MLSIWVGLIQIIQMSGLTFTSNGLSTLMPSSSTARVRGLLSSDHRSLNSGKGLERFSHAALCSTKHSNKHRRVPHWSGHSTSSPFAISSVMSLRQQPQASCWGVGIPLGLAMQDPAPVGEASVALSFPNTCALTLVKASGRSANEHTSSSTCWAVGVFARHSLTNWNSSSITARTTTPATSFGPRSERSSPPCKEPSGIQLASWPHWSEVPSLHRPF